MQTATTQLIDIEKIPVSWGIDPEMTIFIPASNDRNFEDLRELIRQYIPDMIHRPKEHRAENYQRALVTNYYQ